MQRTHAHTQKTLKPKSVFAQWNNLIKKKIFSIIIHISVLRKSSLRDYWNLRPIIHTPYAASVGMSWDRFLVLLTLFHLNNSDTKAARGQQGYDPLFKIRPVTETLITKFQDIYTPAEQPSMRQYANFEGIYSFMFISKECPTNMGQKCLNFVRQKAAMSAT